MLDQEEHAEKDKYAQAPRGIAELAMASIEQCD
jgi:hypothetical protein